MNEGRIEGVGVGGDGRLLGGQLKWVNNSSATNEIAANNSFSNQNLY